jgi:hypothetical protein
MRLTELAHTRSIVADNRRARQAAEAVNDILTIRQSLALQAAMDAMPEIADVLAEQAFEAYGWPEDDVDENWLTSAGSYTFAIYRAYRAGRAGVVS